MTLTQQFKKMARRLTPVEMAAAELRRLHESNQELLAAYQEALATLKLMASHAKWLNVTTDSFILKLERTTL